MAQVGSEVEERPQPGRLTNEEVPGELEALEAVRYCLFRLTRENKS